MTFDPASIRGFDYGPFRDGQNPNTPIYPTAAELAQDVTILAPITNYIRLYSTQNGFADVIPDAAADDLTVIPGAYLSALYPANNSDEIASLITTVNQYKSIMSFPFVVVGNEALDAPQNLDAGTLIGDISQVRAGIAGAAPIATGEEWNTWLQNPNLANAADVLLVDVYPYHEGISIGQAVAYAIARVQQVQAAYPDKIVMIGETGWPSAGETVGQAVPSPANEETYAAGILQQTAQLGIGILYFEAFDEAWKATPGNINQGNFGLYTSTRDGDMGVAKGAVQNTFTPASTANAAQDYGFELLRAGSSGETASWAKLLDAGMLSSVQVAGDFAASAEAASYVLPIARLYTGLFDRAPDAAGFGFWVNLLRSGSQSLGQIAAGFTGSAEFASSYGAPGSTSAASFVTALYHDVLDRAPDAPGLAFWVAQLPTLNAATEGAVALAFTQSAEYAADANAPIRQWLANAGESGSYAASVPIFPTGPSMPLAPGATDGVVALAGIAHGGAGAAVDALALG